MRTVPALSAAVLLAALAGCHRVTPRPPLEEGHTGAAGRPLAEAPRTARPPSEKPVPAAPGSADAGTGAGQPATEARAGAGNSAAIMGSAGEHVSDASITAHVNAALAADKELRPLKIDVDTQNGIVTLSGLAPTASAKAHADEVAHRIAGVVSVNNQLTLRSG